MPDLYPDTAGPPIDRDDLTSHARNRPHQTPTIAVRTAGATSPLSPRRP